MNQNKIKTILATEWDLNCFYKSDNDPRIDIDIKNAILKSKEFAKKWEPTKEYLSNPKVLLTALQEYEYYITNNSLESKLYPYISLRLSQENSNPSLKALKNKVNEASIKVDSALEFFFNRLSKIDNTGQKIFLDSPELINYKNFLHNLFLQSKYILSEAEEKIISVFSKTSHSNWVNMTSSFLQNEKAELVDEGGVKTIKTFSEIVSLTSSTNKKTRDSATMVLNKILKKHVLVAENEINSILETKKNLDLLKGINRSDLTRHISDGIESEVVDCLIKVVSDNFHISREYYKLKALLFGVKKLAYNERSVPYGSVEKKYSYAKSVGIVKKVFAKLDKEFLNFYSKMLIEGRFSVYPKKGKSGGAFCSASTISNPIFILLNHTGKAHDVTTIAHEMGHALNDFYMKRQTEINFGTSLATAEVASTFMEDFVFEELIKGQTDEEKLSLMIAKMDDCVSTVFRQVACYKFEQDLHNSFRKKGYLSYKEIGTIFTKHMAAYMGNAVEQSKGSENWWVYWPHIRRFFYVYSYASGLLISKALQSKYREDINFINKIKEFLATGTSLSPKDTFLKMGIIILDTNFWNSGLAEIENLLKDITLLAQKLGKI